MHGWCVCVCALLFAVFDMQLHWKVQLKYINRNDLSVEHSPDIPLISNEMKRMKNQQTNTLAHTSSAHISFVLSWRFPWCSYFFIVIWILNTIIFLLPNERHTVRVYAACEGDSKKCRFDVYSLYTTIFLFVVCFSQRFTFFGRFSQDQNDGFFRIFSYVSSVNGYCWSMQIIIIQ